MVQITVICLSVTAASQAKAFYFDKLTVLTNADINVDADFSIHRDQFYRWAVKIPTIGVLMVGINLFFMLLWHVGMYFAGLQPGLKNQKLFFLFLLTFYKF